METIYGGSLSFERLEGRRACRVADYEPGDVTDTERWEAYIDWFFDAGTRLRAAVNAALP